MLIKGKKGAGHIEAILSFIIFAGFLFFIVIIFNPFSSQIDVELIDSVFTNLEEKTKTQVSSVSFSLNDPESLNDPGSSSGCFTLDIKNLFEDMDCPLNVGSTFKTDKITVKDSLENSVDSEVNPSTNKINIGSYGLNIDKLYTIYCSENILDSSYQSCSDGQLEEGNDYILGQIVKRKLWSDQLLFDLETEYNTDYENLKDEIVVQGNDFEFIVWDLDTQSPIYQGTQGRKPRATRIDSQTLGIDALTLNGEIVKRTISITVW